MLRQAFGDEVIDHYVHAGRWEQARLRQGGHRLGARALLRARASAPERTALTLAGPWRCWCWGLALAGLARWHETRPRELGEVRLFPATLVLAIGVSAPRLAAAHLVSLLTGIPLVGATPHESASTLR